jgi:hypothetical protein
MLGEPTRIAQVLGTTVVISAVMYIVTKQVLASQNLSGGMWDLATFILSIIPVMGGIIYVFQ